MNRKWKQTKKSMKQSPVLFEDEDTGTSSPDEVNINKSTAMSRSKSLTGHSTPIRNKTKTDSSDSPDLNYNESPIEPLTQHPPNEVGWDYHRPLTKEESKSPVSMDISKTPKRSVFLTKKRNSNSPLLYKPLKKKLIQEEQQEHLVGFMAELKAIEMKAKQFGEKIVELPQESNDDTQSQLIVDMDSQSDNSDIKLQVSANTDESPGQSKPVKENKNYDALLDDSIEDIMVLCSQEVEAKEFGITNAQNLVQPATNSSYEKNSSKTSSNSSLEKSSHTKENLESINGEKTVTNLTSKSSTTSKRNSGSLEIPDDSFDEFFVDLDDKDFCKNVNTEIIISSVNKTVKSKNSLVQNKFFHSKSTTCNTQSKVSTCTINHNHAYNTESSKISNTIQNKVVNTNANFGYLNKDYAKKTNTGVMLNTQTNDNNKHKNNESRLLKSKSLSESNFLQNSAATAYSYRSNSNVHVNSISWQREQNKNYVNKNEESSGYASGSASQSKSWRRVHSSSSLDNSQLASINTVNNSEGSQSSPAEIERKRQQAIMKREAKLKMQFNNMSLKRPSQQPIKR